MRIFDTDILIWFERGNQKAAHLINTTNERAISIITYMELLQLAPSKEKTKKIRSFLIDSDFKILPISENIGHRAAIYIEEFSSANGVQVTDALIAASVIEYGAELVTGNKKHFSIIPNLPLNIFRP